MYINLEIFVGSHTVCCFLVLGLEVVALAASLLRTLLILLLGQTAGKISTGIKIADVNNYCVETTSN